MDYELDEFNEELGRFVSYITDKINEKKEELERNMMLGLPFKEIDMMQCVIEWYKEYYEGNLFDEVNVRKLIIMLDMMEVEYDQMEVMRRIFESANKDIDIEVESKDTDLEPDLDQFNEELDRFVSYIQHKINEKKEELERNMMLGLPFKEIDMMQCVIEWYMEYYEGNLLDELNVGKLIIVLDRMEVEYDQMEVMRRIFESANKDADNEEDYIQLDINNMTGIEFENLSEELLKRMGFQVKITKKSGDGGIDLIAYNSQPFLEGKYIVQCKRWNSSIGEPILRDLYGVVMSERANKGILVTNSYFTDNAKKFARDKQIELIDGAKLIQLIKKYEININSKKNDFSFISDNLYNWDKVKILIEEVSNDSYNLSLRMRLINNLTETINFSIMSPNQSRYLYSKLEENLKFIVNSDNSKGDDNIMYLKYCSGLVLSTIRVLHGDFDSAIKVLLNILNGEWDKFNYCETLRCSDYLIELKSLIVKNIYEILGYFDLKNEAYILKNSYVSLYKTARNILPFAPDYLDKVYNLNKYSGEVCIFKVDSWNRVGGINNIVRKLKGNSIECEYLIDTLTFVKFKDLYNLEGNIFNIDNKDMQRQRIEALF